jgi:hypothetical protein
MSAEKGQALPLAILALTIGMLVIAPFLGHASSSLISSRTYGEVIAHRNACDAGVEHAIWSLTRGSLAEQLPDPGDEITYQLGETLNGVSTTITVTANVVASGGTIGDIGAVIDTLIFDTSAGYTPEILAVSNNICAIAYRGSSNKGNVITASIAPDGNIGNSVIGSLNFQSSNCYELDFIHVTGNIYAIPYRGASIRGIIKTVSIATNGTIGGSIISTVTFDSSTCYEPNIVQVASNIFAIAYRGSTNRGYIKTVSIAADGTIGSSVISTLIFDTSACYNPVIIQVASGIYAIVYRGTSNRGYIKTVSIAANGVIGSSVISTLIFDNSACYEPDIVQVASNIFAIAYRGPSNNGYLKTISIAANGVISSSVISTFIFNASTAYEPDIVQVASNTFAIAYRDSSNRGYLKTVSIASDGTISPAVIDTLNFETSTCYEPSLLNVSGNIYAIAYRGTSNYGYVKTININKQGGTPSASYEIVATAGGKSIRAFVNTENETASIVSWQIE